MSVGTSTSERDSTQPPQRSGDGGPPQPPKPKHRRWGFFTASLVILGLMILGEAVGRQWERASAMLESTSAIGWRGWTSIVVGGLFLLCSFVLALMNWRAVRHFFLSIKVGVSMITIATLAVMAGVLVPQIEGFEDPEVRVTEENYEEQYEAFAYAESYFIWHMLHLYGIGGPIEEAKEPPGGWESIGQRLEQFGRKYGREEQKNREKEMRAAFANRAKMAYITGGNVLEREDGELQQAYVEGFVNEHEDFLRAFFDVSTALQLNRAYKSWWFKTLMVMIAISVAMNFLRMPFRAMFTIEKAGFAIVHLGVFTMLFGGGISNTFTDRGILHLDLREPPRNTYWRHYNRDKLSKMPFWVGLDHFARQDWRTIQVLYEDADFSSRPPEYTLWPGRVIELDFREYPVDEDAVRAASASDADVESDAREVETELLPRILLEVLALHDHARPGAMELSDAEPDEAGEGPVAVVEVPDLPRIMQARAEGREPVDPSGFFRKSYLAPEHPGADLLYGQDWTYRLKGVFADRVPPKEELFPPKDRLGTLAIRMSTAGDVQAHRLSIALGETVEDPSGFTLRAVEATANYQQDAESGGEIRDARPLAEQPPFAPGVWLEITPPDGGPIERRLVLQGVDSETHAQQKDYDYPELIVDLEWEYWRSAGPPRYVLHWGPDGEATLIDEAGRRTPVEPGRSLPLGEESLPLRLHDVYADAKFETQVEFLPEKIGEDGFDRSFYSDDAPGLELKITIRGDDGTLREDVRKLAATPGGLVNAYRAPDESFDVVFYENDRAMPFEWRSVLSIYDEVPGDTWRLYSGRDGAPIRVSNGGEAHEFFDRGFRIVHEDGRSVEGYDPGRVSGHDHEAMDAAASAWDGTKSVALTAQDADNLEARFGRNTVALNRDVDGDGEGDWVGPVRRVDRGSERDREIRVNDYFTHGGFRFFQTNAIPEIPTYSGIGVVYDPGIEPVLFGMYTIILGTVVAYIVRPIVKSRRERRRAAA